LQVSLDAEAAELRVVDGTPGGNGLSEALLTEGRVKTAWKTVSKQLKVQARKSNEFFRRFLADECHVDSPVAAEEIIIAVERMASAWNG
jgi:hypothetical protein